MFKEKSLLSRFSDLASQKIMAPTVLFWCPFIVFLLGAGIAFFLAIYIFLAEGLIYQNFCLRSDCIESFQRLFAPVYGIGVLTSSLIIAIVTVLAAFTAVHTYQVSVKNSALANHIAHFNLFREYLTGEIAKLPRIDKKSVDIFKLFVFIFPRSRDGDLEPSSKYLDFLNDLKVFVHDTEEKYSGDRSGIFYSFKNHQGLLRRKLDLIGIRIDLKPNKTDFFLMEHDVYELIRRINECFCPSEMISAIPTPKYS